jgi:hypothetical protein
VPRRTGIGELNSLQIVNKQGDVGADKPSGLRGFRARNRREREGGLLKGANVPGSGSGMIEGETSPYADLA